jgi:adenylate cyclase
MSGVTGTFARREAIGPAQDMLEASERWQQAHRLTLPIRIGLASGPVVGGVIGRQRILFDLWGDTLNTAARIQSTGVPGRIHVTEGTRQRASGHFEFEERVVDVKGLGSLTTYLVVEP